MDYQPIGLGFRINTWNDMESVTPIGLVKWTGPGLEMIRGFLLSELKNGFFVVFKQ
jgi:hypothetical protein